MNDCRTRYACRLDACIVCVQQGDGGCGGGGRELQGIVGG